MATFILSVKKSVAVSGIAFTPFTKPLGTSSEWKLKLNCGMGIKIHM